MSSQTEGQQRLFINHEAWVQTEAMDVLDRILKQLEDEVHLELQDQTELDDQMGTSNAHDSLPEDFIFWDAPRVERSLEN